MKSTNNNKGMILNNIIKGEKGVIKTNANNIMNKIGGHGTNNRNKKKHSEVVKNNKIVVEQDEKKINPSAMNNK